MARAFYKSLLLSTLPWITILWFLKIVDDKRSYIIILLLGCFCSLIYHCQIYPVYTSPFRSLATPKTRSYWMGNHSTPVKLIGQELPRLCTEFLGEQIVRYYTFFSVEMIIVLGQEAISELCFKKSNSFSHSKSIELLAEAGLGYPGLLAARGQEHKVVHLKLIYLKQYLRKLFSPMFTPGRIAQMSSLLLESCHILVQDIGQHGSSLNISQWISQSILDLSGVYVLGQDVEWLARYPSLRGSLERRVATGQIKKIVLSIFPRPIRSLLMLFLFNRKDLADVRYLEYVARDLLQTEKRKLAEPVKSNRPINLISVMLEDASLSDEEMIGHILIFLVGASETTSASVQWMILELCRNEGVQTKLRNEIQSLSSLSMENDHAGSTSEFAFAQVDSGLYIRAVVDELLRLHPTVALTEHEATCDTTILDVPIPKGTLLLCPPLAANLNTQVWGEDATSFKPERWLIRESASKKISQHPCANMTFSHGPRSCPGRSIARLMLKCFTAAFIGQYQVSLVNPEQPFASTEAVYVRPMPDLIVRLVRAT